MLKWTKTRPLTARNRPEPDEEVQRGRVMTGKYLLLYKYLVNRYATTVVLTFGEIEDILGFTLPGLARLHQEWWTSPDLTVDRLNYSDAWILASRTARPNLHAQTVTFERPD